MLVRFCGFLPANVPSGCNNNIFHTNLDFLKKKEKNWILKYLAIFAKCMCLMGASTNNFLIFLLNLVFQENYFSKKIPKIIELEYQPIEFAYLQKFSKLANFAYIWIARGKKFMMIFLNRVWLLSSFSGVHCYPLDKVMLIYPHTSICPCHFHIRPFRFSAFLYC